MFVHFTEPVTLIEQAFQWAWWMIAAAASIVVVLVMLLALLLT